jgi:hypothetical protein
MKLFLVIFVGLLMIGCGKSENRSAPASDTNAETNVQDTTQWKPISNDDIINETKKCESAGLDAESLKVEKVWGPKQ